jgi:hypothetical protein
MLQMLPWPVVIVLLCMGVYMCCYPMVGAMCSSQAQFSATHVRNEVLLALRILKQSLCTMRH